jgi:hypothetical protein
VTDIGSVKVRSENLSEMASNGLDCALDRLIPRLRQRLRELGSQRADVFLIPQTELRTQIYDCCAATAGWAWLGAIVAADPCSVARYASDAQDVAAVWARRMG